MLLAAVMSFVSCSDNNDPTYLGEIRVSQSYVSLPMAGGSTSITVTATDSWEASGVPSWLTLSATSGQAGESTLTFTAASTLDGRTGSLTLVCGGKSQIISVIQGVATVSSVTCAEIIAGPDSKTYQVTGTVKSIANTIYGNWYIEDETGEVYIYGTRDKSGNNGANNSIAAWGIDVGDVLTIQGPKTTYNGTVELVDVTVISIKKSLIKIESGAENSFDAEGGDFMVQLKVSGDGPYIDIDEEAKAWLGITSVVKTDTTTNVSFHVAANDAEAARNGVITFHSNNGSASSSVEATVSQMGLMGTLTNPFSVADAIAYAKAIGGPSAKEVYIKGIISRIADKGEFGSYGNATFWISDDGEFLGTDDKNPDLAHDFEAYRVIWLGNQKWAEGNAQVSVGDEVILCAKTTVYKDIAETVQNEGYIYSINGATSDDNGIGSAAAPFNIAGAMACIDNGYAGNVFVKGIISKIANNGQFGAQYGNATFWISDDGTYNDDLTKDFEAYRVLYMGNRKWVDGDSPIAEGDEVILCGQLTKYGSTYETASGKAWIYSLNGKTE